MTPAPEPDEAAHRAREQDPRPIVRRPPDGLPAFAIALVAALVACLLFFMLDARRRHPAVRAEAIVTGGSSAVPSLVVPPDIEGDPTRVPAPRSTIVTSTLPGMAVRASPSPPPPFIPSPLPATEPSVHDAPQAAAPRSTEPALVFDSLAGAATPSGAGAASNAQGAPAGADDTAVQTTTIGNHANVMPAGTQIAAVLETPIDTARPGLVRAVVSEDARGFDGSRVLVPRGSRLIGDYQSDVRSGQNRVFITWNRLIRPDGAAVRISSPAADALGGAGIPGRVNSFFLQRFAGALLQSALTVGVNLASRSGNGSVVVALPSGSSGSIGQDLIPGSDLKPKIKVKQGALLNVFVAHDLDFSGAPNHLRSDAR